jgi:hypothetical protein
MPRTLLRSGHLASVRFSIPIHDSWLSFIFAFSSTCTTWIYGLSVPYLGGAGASSGNEHGVIT